MNFLIDAQLPRRLTRIFQALGADAVHTSELSGGNRTSDTRINEISQQENRIVVTKDSDFVTSFILSGTPYKLLLISTGNIRNAELDNLISRNLLQIVDAFNNHHFLELDRNNLIVHI